MRWTKSFMLYLALISPQTYMLLGLLLALAGVAYAGTLVTTYDSPWAQQSTSGVILTFPIQLIDPILPQGLRDYWKRNAAVTRKYGVFQLKSEQAQAEIDKSWNWVLGLVYLASGLSGPLLAVFVLQRLVARTAGRRLQAEFRLLRQNYYRRSGAR